MTTLLFFLSFFLFSILSFIPLFLFLFIFFFQCLDPPFLTFFFLSLLDVTYYPDVFFALTFFYFCYVDWGFSFGVKRYIPCAI